MTALTKNLSEVLKISPGDALKLVRANAAENEFELVTLNPAVANLSGVNTGDQASEPYIYIRDEKASGTNGGTFTSGAWQTRDLNTEMDDAGNNAAIASNQITLVAGTYRVRASAPAFHVQKHKIRLQNITDGTTVQSSNGKDLVGTSEDSLVTSDVTSRSFVSGRFTIAADKALELQHQCTDTTATIGFGVAASFGVVEVYAEIEFWKEY